MKKWTKGTFAILMFSALPVACLGTMHKSYDDNAAWKSVTISFPSNDTASIKYGIIELQPLTSTSHWSVSGLSSVNKSGYVTAVICEANSQRDCYHVNNLLVKDTGYGFRFELNGYKKVSDIRFVLTGAHPEGIMHKKPSGITLRTSNYTTRRPVILNGSISDMFSASDYENKFDELIALN